VPGTGTGARGDDLADGSEIKSCNKVDQVDKCKDCGSRVLRMEKKCSNCNSENIDRKNDSKWLFSIRDDHELKQYENLERIVLLLMDYPNFAKNDYDDIRITVFEIYPKDERMKVFNKLISNHYKEIYLPKRDAKEKTNPMNLHPDSFQFYKCNPIKTFECVITDIDTNPIIKIKEGDFIAPRIERGNNVQPVPMPTYLLQEKEWNELLANADYDQEIKPLICSQFLKTSKLTNLERNQFISLNKKKKESALPFLDMNLRNKISLRPINTSVRQKKHYRRG
jgi:hypothetical protein